jgi:hypothetical protein
MPQSWDQFPSKTLHFSIPLWCNPPSKQNKILLPMWAFSLLSYSGQSLEPIVKIQRFNHII